MSPRHAAGVLLTSGSGRVGAVFLITLMLISLFVLVRFPMDFGPQRWNNPAVWADNPKAVPPAWAGPFLGDDVVSPHTVLRASEPSSVAPAGGAETQLYSFTYDYQGGTPPTFIALTVSDVRFQSRPPVISIQVKRPDGRALTLFRQVVRGPRQGEEAPYIRYGETPLRIGLTGERDVAVALSDFLSEAYGVRANPNDLQGRTEEAMFGEPVPGESLAFAPLAGRYEFTVQALMGDAADEAGSVKLVLGGSTYGAMGTDALGRDLALGLLFGFPVALAIGLSTSLLATTIGTFMGIMSGFLAGKTDLAIQRFADIWSNIPLLPILIFLIFILGQKLWLVVVIMILFGWPGLTIVVRSMVLQIRTGQLVEATRALGASRRRIMFRHILF